MLDIKVPILPESVADATVSVWHKKVGDFVEKDEIIVEIETDKVMLEVPAVENGVITSILEDEGAIVTAEQLLGALEVKDISEKTENVSTDTASKEGSKPAEAKTTQSSSAREPQDMLYADGTPSERRLAAEKGVSIQDLSLKSELFSSGSMAARSEKRVPMSRLRQTIAKRLLEAKNSTAMLTTFNEVDMSPIMNLRSKYKDDFEKNHGVRLGFMSFYVKAAVEALKLYPSVNASIDGNDIVYHNYFDISIAVSTDKGLVTPVLKDCDSLEMFEIESGIKDLALKGRDNKLTIEDITGGNFTITNGGVFGSLLSTPILNLPQTAILGMHKIEERPVVENGQVVIKPMMYLALSYDHRVIDGKESVGFLVAIKNLLEDPTRLLLKI